MRSYFLSGVAAAALCGLTTMALADEQDGRVRELNNQALQQAQQQSQAAATTPSAPGGITAESSGGIAPKDNVAANEKSPADVPDSESARGSGQPEQTAAAPGQNTMSPSATAQPSADTNAVAASEIKNPKQTLANASVETKEGQKVGEVSTVVTDEQGRASAVMLTAQGDQTVRVDAKTLTFFPDRGVLVTELSARDINPSAPPAPVTPPPTDAQLPTGETQPMAPSPTGVKPN